MTSLTRLKEILSQDTGYTLRLHDRSDRTCLEVDNRPKY